MAFESKFTIALAVPMRRYVEQLAKARGTSVADAIRYIIGLHMEDMARRGRRPKEK